MHVATAHFARLGLVLRRQAFHRVRDAAAGKLESIVGSERRRGNEIVLREKKRTLAEALATLPPISEAEIAELDSVMSEARTQPKIQERDWAKLGRPGKATSRSPRKPR